MSRRETRHNEGQRTPNNPGSNRKITLHFTNQTLTNRLFAMSIRDRSLQIRRAIAEDPYIQAHPRGGNWVVEVDQLENGDLEVFTETAEDRGRLAHDMIWARIFEECLRDVVEGEGSSRGEILVAGADLGRNAKYNGSNVGPNPSQALPRRTGAQLEEEEEEDDSAISKYDPFPLVPRDPSFDRLNILFFPPGTQAPPSTPATALSRKRKAAEPAADIRGAAGCGNGNGSNAEEEEEKAEKETGWREEKETGWSSRDRTSIAAEIWEGADGEGVEWGGLLRLVAMSIMCMLSSDTLTPAKFSLEWS